MPAECAVYYAVELQAYGCYQMRFPQDTMYGWLGKGRSKGFQSVRRVAVTVSCELDSQYEECDLRIKGCRKRR